MKMKKEIKENLTVAERRVVKEALGSYCRKR